jgi:hypothetical protein
MTLSGLEAESTTTTPAFAENDPTETIVIAMPPPKPHHDRPISQTTEHLLIAAGSIGTLKSMRVLRYILTFF